MHFHVVGRAKLQYITYYVPELLPDWLNGLNIERVVSQIKKNRRWWALARGMTSVGNTHSLRVQIDQYV